MKNLLLALAVICSVQFVSAQYCGNSGGGQCTSPGQVTHFGFGPPFMQAAPLVNGVANNPVIEFFNADTLTFGGQVLTMDSLTFDTITNLPPGLCWSTNKPLNTFLNQEDGCIKLSGTPCGVPGQYKLHMIIKAYTTLPFPVTTNMDATGIYYYLRLVNSGETPPAVDTTGLSSSTAPDFIAFGPASNCQVGPPTVSLGSNQTVCNNSNIILDPVITGGAAPFTYSWQYTGNPVSCNTCGNPSATINQTSTYTVAVTDANNYVAVANVTYTVSGTNNLIQLTTANTNINCASATDNTTLTILNGSSPYSLNWGDGNTQTGVSSSAPVHVYTAAGVYPIVVTDALGCASAAYDTVLNTGIIITAGNVTRPNCWGMATGGVPLNVSGGTLPYTYAWSNSATTSSLTGVVAGNYSVTVNDATLCSAIFYYYLSPLSDPWGYYTYLNGTDANCSNNGAVAANVYGGVQPYLYQWSNGSTTQNISALGYGNYVLTVTDSAGCQTTGSAYVTSSCYSYINGFAFSDTNNNCLYDAGESPLTSIYIRATSPGGNSYYGSTDNTGHYVIAVNETGLYTLTAFDYYGYNYGCGNLTFCGGGNQTANIATLGDTVTNGNIGLTGASGFNLGIHPGWTSANPGFSKQYWVFYYNTSPAPYTGTATITLAYDSNLIYQYSDETPAPVVDANAHTLTWTVNMGVDTSQYGYNWTRLDGNFQVPLSLSLNYLLHSDFRITPVVGDCDSSDNHYYYSEPVTGSHDPNEKTVSPAGPVTAEDSVLTYTIHFQNTGTDSTHFVIIKDTLSPNLDPSTVRNIASSDKYSSFTITGKGILTWTFNPLRIVDSMTNPTGSKRFVMFTVKKKGTLPIGTTISNNASIYFDYNDAVVTNTVRDTETWPLNVYEISNDKNVNVRAFPNPFSNVTNIVVTGLNEKFGFELYDVTGRLQQTLPSIDNSQFQVHRGQLARGVYLYRIIVANKPAAYGKLVVE